MLKLYLIGMQKLPLECNPTPDIARSIHRISYYRMLYCLQVNTNLVRAPGL